MPEKGKTNNPAGRPKGVPNKITTSIKAAFKEAFDEMGGAPALVKWGAENPTEFYKLVTKLIPTEITGPDGSAPVWVINAPAVDKDAKDWLNENVPKD